MNKYTLKFLEPQLEERYQTQENMNNRRKMFIYININAFIFCMINLISLLNNEIKLAYFLQTVGALGLFSLISIFTYKYHKHCQLLLTLLNHLIIIIQCNSIEINTGSQEAFNLGANTTILCFMILNMCDFWLGGAQIVSISLVRLLFSYLKGSVLRPGVYVAMGITAFLFIVTKYNIDKANRQMFLLTLKDSQWERFLPKIISKPFVLFGFDTSKFSFEFKLANQLVNTIFDTDSLKIFLRKAIVKQKQSLEQMLYSLIKAKNQDDNMQQLPLSYKKQIHKIQFTHFYLTDDMFLLVFDIEDLKIKKIEKQYDKFTKMNKGIFLKHILNQCKAINNCIKTKNYNLMKKIRYINIMILLKHPMNSEYQWKFEILHIAECLRFIKNIISDKEIFIVNNPHDKIIITIKNLFLDVIICKINLFKSKKIYITYFINKKQQLDLNIKGQLLLTEYKQNESQYSRIVNNIEVISKPNLVTLHIVFHQDQDRPFELI